MAHPFFDVLSYPWNRKDAQALYEILKKAEKNSTQITLIYNQCASGLPSLTQPAPTDNMWIEVLNNLTRVSNGLRNLCAVLKQKFSNTKELTDAILEVEQALSASEEFFFKDEHCILDCDHQRDAITKSLTDSAPKVLLIRGDSKSGKSHCRYILHAIAEERGAKVIYLCDGLVTVLQEAIENLFSALGAGNDKIPPVVTTEDAWYRSICVKLRELASAKETATSPVRIWIVADDLGYVEGGPMIDTKIRVFFEQFALFMLDPSFAQHFRLLLINYAEKTTPTKWKAQMWAEVTTKEDAIQQSHIELFLRRWAYRKKITLIEADLVKTAEEVISKALNPPEDIAKLSRLERIYKILVLKLDEIVKRA